MNKLYIYYRVREENAVRLASLVRSLQAGLGQGEVLRRPEARDGLQTWMEVYAASEVDFINRLDLAVAAAGMAALIDGPRHVETFVELPPCA